MSLVWRRQNPKLFDTRTNSEISKDDFRGLNSEIREKKISRRPLRPEETTALIDIAVKLHERAIEDQKAKLWWIPVLSAILSFIGAIVGVLLAS